MASGGSLMVTVIERQFSKIWFEYDDSVIVRSRRSQIFYLQYDFILHMVDGTPSVTASLSTPPEIPLWPGTSYPDIKQNALL